MLQFTRLAAATLILTLTASAASAMGPCAQHSDIVARLKQQFGEVEVGRGLSNRGYLMEVFASAAGTWTILLSQADGVSCLADAGEAWEATLPDGSHDAMQQLPESNTTASPRAK